MKVVCRLVQRGGHQETHLKLSPRTTGSKYLNSEILTQHFLQCNNSSINERHCQEGILSEKDVEGKEKMERHEGKVSDYTSISTYVSYLCSGVTLFLFLSTEPVDS